MQYKKFILSFGDDGVQEEELNRFLRSHRILKVEQQLLPQEQIWAFLVCYLDGEQDNSARPAQRNKAEFNPEKELTPQQLDRFKTYRDVRLEIARRAGVKAFVVFSNRELADVARLEELSEKTLRGISGMGEERMKQYGKEFINLVKEKEHEASGQPDGEDNPF